MLDNQALLKAENIEEDVSSGSLPVCLGDDVSAVLECPYQGQLKLFARRHNVVSTARSRSAANRFLRRVNFCFQSDESFGTDNHFAGSCSPAQRDAKPIFQSNWLEYWLDSISCAVFALHRCLRPNGLALVWQ